MYSPDLNIGLSYVDLGDSARHSRDFPERVSKSSTEPSPVVKATVAAEPTSPFAGQERQNLPVRPPGLAVVPTPVAQAAGQASADSKTTGQESAYNSDSEPYSGSEYSSGRASHFGSETVRFPCREPASDSACRSSASFRSEEPPEPSAGSRSPLHGSASASTSNWPDRD